MHWKVCKYTKSLLKYNLPSGVNSAATAVNIIEISRDPAQSTKSITGDPARFWIMFTAGAVEATR